MKKWLWRGTIAVFAAGAVAGILWLLDHYLEQSGHLDMHGQETVRVLESENSTEAERISKTDAPDKTETSDKTERVSKTDASAETTEKGKKSGEKERGRSDNQEAFSGSSFLVRLEEDPMIRVQLLGDAYEEEYHRQIVVTSKAPFTVEAGEEMIVIEAGTRLVCTGESRNMEESQDTEGSQSIDGSPGAEGNQYIDESQNTEGSQRIDESLSAEGNQSIDGSLSTEGNQYIDGSLSAEGSQSIDESQSMERNRNLDEGRNQDESPDKTYEYGFPIQKLPEGGCCIISPSEGALLELPELIRDRETAEYAGKLYLYPVDNGICVVNELPLEEYLYGVVGSEMPSSFPAEALKAQAVCARSFAYQCIQRSSDGEKNFSFRADLDDSVSFQVYNNQESSAAAVAAVEATAGEILPLTEIQYYSTSCQSRDRTDLADEELFRKFLSQEPEEGAEYGSAWVRWEATVTAQEVLERVCSWYGFTGKRVEALLVTKRKPDGQAEELVVSGDGAQVTISGEYEIRRVLAVSEGTLVLADGQTVSGMALLPSAWFYIREPDERQKQEESEPESENTGNVLFYLTGGGYGHGRGMSQMGAADMAMSGASYQEILKYYYVQ